MGECIGCKMGVWLFAEGGIKNIPNSNKGELYHADLMGAGFFVCRNADEMWPHLHKNNRGWLEPDEELKKEMELQELWWESMMYLSEDVFGVSTKFLNELTADGRRKWQLPYAEIEAELLTLAESKGIKVTEDEYSGLLKFRNNGEV